MKTPTQHTYTYPARYPAHNLRYQVDWSLLLDTGESVTTASAAVTAGDSVISNVATVSNVTTFWLSAGSTAVAVHTVTITGTSTTGEVMTVVGQVPVLS